MDHFKKTLKYFRNKSIIPKDWEDKDITFSYSKNMLINPFDKRKYVITHKETGKTIYTSLSLKELDELENGKIELLYWKNVFNGSLKQYNDIFSCHEVARQAEYEYFAFNDKVYRLLNDNSFIETDRSVGDLI